METYIARVFTTTKVICYNSRAESASGSTTACGDEHFRLLLLLCDFHVDANKLNQGHVLQHVTLKINLRTAHTRRKPRRHFLTYVALNSTGKRRVCRCLLEIKDDLKLRGGACELAETIPRGYSSSSCAGENNRTTNRPTASMDVVGKVKLVSYEL